MVCYYHFKQWQCAAYCIRTRFPSHCWSAKYPYCDPYRHSKHYIHSFCKSFHCIIVLYLRLPSQVNVTQTVTYTSVTTLPALTVTAPTITVTPTKLITPKPATRMSTKILYTVYRTVPRVTVS